MTFSSLIDTLEAPNGRTTTHLIQEIKQLADVVCDGRRVWIATLQMLFVDFANAFHAFVDALIIAVSTCLRTSAWLYQQNCVRHVCFGFESVRSLARTIEFTVNFKKFTYNLYRVRRRKTFFRSASIWMIISKEFMLHLPMEESNEIICWKIRLRRGLQMLAKYSVNVHCSPLYFFCCHSLRELPEFVQSKNNRRAHHWHLWRRRKYSNWTAWPECLLIII